MSAFMRKNIAQHLWILGSRPAFFTARQHSIAMQTAIIAIVDMYDRPSVCPSRASIVWKRRKLGSRNLH